MGAILFRVFGCLLSILDWAVQFINEYAFSYIALYVAKLSCQLQM
jgi:hypothetical protein